MKNKLEKADTESVIRLPQLFSDHMVIQCKEPISVRGTITKDEAVTVSLLSQRVIAVPSNGHWHAELAPVPAGGPYELVVSSESCRIEIKDVYAGEVWVCGGQSNMAWPLDKAANGQEEAAEAEYPLIRFFKQDARGADEPCDDVANGSWQPTQPDSAGSCYAVAYYFGKALYARLGVPIGLLLSAVGGTAAQYWMSRGALEADADFLHYTASRGSCELLTQQEQLKQPSVLYNAMIAPLLRYPVRGVIWYQGERNANHYGPIEYRKLFPALIQDWRDGWRREGLPFLFVQLPGLDNGKGESWALLREAQLMAMLNVPNTWMAVAIDAGERSNLHPINKKPIGERLSLLALGFVYGAGLKLRSPIYERMAIHNGKVLLRFSDTGEGLFTSEGKVRGFTICGEDGIFREAQAQIEGSDTVVVWHQDIIQPTAVRYGWAGFPDCNLYGSGQWPVVPFRTDGLYELAARETNVTNKDQL
jgi:sialate O-acetylesterase